MDFLTDIQDYLNSYNELNDSEKKTKLINLLNSNIEYVDNTIIDKTFLVADKVVKNTEKQLIFLIFEKIKKQIKEDDYRTNEYFFKKFLNDEKYINEFYTIMIASLKNPKVVGVVSAMFETTIIPSIDSLTKQSIISYINFSNNISNFKFKKISSTHQQQDNSYNISNTQSTQQQQNQLNLDSLFEKFDQYNSKLSDFLKRIDNVFINNDLEFVVLLCNKLFDLYIYGIKLVSTALLNISSVFKSLITNNILLNQSTINKRKEIEYHEIYEKTLISFYESFNLIKPIILKNNNKISSKNFKLFKFYSVTIQFFIQSFSPIFTQSEYNNTFKLILDVINEIPINKLLCKNNNLDENEKDIKNIIEKILETFLITNSNDLNFIKKFLKQICEHNNTNNINSQNNRQSYLKLTLILFKNHSLTILNNDYLNQDNDNDRLLSKLFKTSIGLLDSGDSIMDIYKLPNLQEILNESFKSFIIHSAITRDYEFFTDLIKLIYFSNNIISSFLINIWYQIIKNSNESFQTWNLQLIIKVILKFNDRFEIPEFLDKLSILLKRVFKILNSNQQKIIYKLLVFDQLSQQQKQDYIIQDNSKFLPISISIFFFIVDNGNKLIDYTLKNDIQLTLVPFLITKLNQENIYGYPNLMENLLFILSKINYNLKSDDINLINSITIEILKSITESQELLKLFESSLICQYCFEILGQNCDHLSAPQLQQVLNYCSTIISQQPLSKYSICTFISKIGQSSNTNLKLLKLDQSLIIKNFKSIYSNLFQSPSLSLFLLINIQESLKSFILPLNSPFNNNSNYLLTNNSSGVESDIMDINDDLTSQQQQQQPKENKFLKLYLNEIIPKEELNKVNDFLYEKKSQPLGIIPLEEKRFSQEIDTIQKVYKFNELNLDKRFNSNLNCQQIIISSQFPIKQPKPISPTLQSQTQKLLGNNSTLINGINSNTSYLTVSSMGKLTSSNNLSKGFNRDELFLGLNLIKEGVELINSQLNFGIVGTNKMDRESFSNFKRKLSSVADQFSNTYKRINEE